MLNIFKNLFTREELLNGNFGIEREALRVDKNGELSKKPHPKVFGGKMDNKYVTVDFAESQVEMITPVISSLNELYAFLERLYDYVCLNIEDEYLWPQSMPAISPSYIKVADFDSSSKGIEARKYRDYLVEKYGSKKQLISGIHFNFSFNENIISKLYKYFGESDYKLFKDSIYLKVTRNYLKYRWFIVYLLGASPIVHSTYDSKSLEYIDKVNDEVFSSDYAISYRNSNIGYKNLAEVYPDYSSTLNYVKSIENYVENGTLYNYKELYTHVRLKARDNENLLQSLLENGISYIEIRNVDINPFDKVGISFMDMKVLNIFLLFSLIDEEEDYPDWQEEALYNQIAVAEHGLDNLFLKKNGELIDRKKYSIEILNKLKNINKILNLNQEDTLEYVENKIDNYSLTYSYRFKNSAIKNGYIKYCLDLANQYKKDINLNHKDMDILS